ncbi:MAG TPA: hypothetical protein PKE69_04530 [Pyrinomonadaceae bacterium]|nr:hypothetical protein [Pyrinomonadaceae bacterium]
MIKTIKICALLTAVCLVVGVSSMDLYAQKKDKKRFILLKRNERKNAYKTVVENGVIYFEAENVEDPLGGEPLRGEKELEYKCTADSIPLIKKLMFSNGRSNRQKVECLVLISPRIILLDEEN